MAVFGLLFLAFNAAILSSPLGTSTVWHSVQAKARSHARRDLPRWGSSTIRLSALTTSWGSAEWRGGLSRGRGRNHPKTSAYMRS